MVFLPHYFRPRIVILLRILPLLFLSLMADMIATPMMGQAASPPTNGQTVKTDPPRSPSEQQKAQELQNAKPKAFPLTAIPVADNVSVEAVLLPAKICRKVFGKEIGNNYAAVELTISNRSYEQSLLVHSIFIDYSQWALSGSQYLENQNPNLSTWQSASRPSQISSVEYRVARGELLDAQPWTARNWIMRALTAAGALASAYAFSINEQGIVRGIAAFSGQAVPAAQTFWPDETIGQMNRISDLGFQTNRVIPKGSSDVIVAFFPLDRFLTPGLKELFLKSPALFFSPYALMFDPSGQKALKTLVEPVLGRDAGILKRLPTSYAQAYLACTGTDSSSNLSAEECSKKLHDQGIKDVNAQDLQAINFLAHASLNTIRVVIGGEMMVNVDRIPATIESINFDQGNKDAATWKTGDHAGVIKGTYLKGGTIAVDDAADVGNPTFTVDSQRSTDRELYFTMKLTKDVKSPAQLIFRVNKKDSEGKAVIGMPLTFPVEYSSAATDSGANSGKPGQDAASKPTTATANTAAQTPAATATGTATGQDAKAARKTEKKGKKQQ